MQLHGTATTWPGQPRKGSESRQPGSSPSGRPRLARSLMLVMLGGTIGTGLRIGFVMWFPNDPGRFPLTTFAENILGAFLLGFLAVLLIERLRPGRTLHPLLCTGMLGSFTTFSNLSLEWAQLHESGNHVLGLIYPIASIIVGLIAALLGVALARVPFPTRYRKDST